MAVEMAVEVVVFGVIVFDETNHKKGANKTKPY